MDTSITLIVELPEDLHHSLSIFLEDFSEWDFNQVFSVALSHFLKQQKAAETANNRVIQKS